MTTDPDIGVPVPGQLGLDVPDGATEDDLSRARAALADLEAAAAAAQRRAVSNVNDAATAHAATARALDEAVQRARAAGASWAAIGQAARMTRQSAHERWAR